ncbi:unnamed protein product, partial [marine sediment metagenome]
TDTRPGYNRRNGRMLLEAQDRQKANQGAGLERIRDKSEPWRLILIERPQIRRSSYFDKPGPVP